MAKVNVKINELAGLIDKSLQKPGILLVTTTKRGKPNVMTIGWGLIGELWGLPMFAAFVRPSRYTHKLIQEVGDYTVNIPARGMDRVVAACGSVSGRGVDKFKENGLRLVASRRVKSPIIEQCIAHLECKVIYRFSIEKNKLDRKVKSTSYRRGDYHDCYLGKIVATYADRDFKSKLR